LSRSQIQLAWKMPDATEANGYQIDYSSDGVNFSPFATITDSTARSFTAANLDYLTAYTFTVSAYNDDGESDGSDTASETTTNAGWENLGSPTPNPADATQPNWFGQGGGSGTPWDQGTYRVNYAGGAYYAYAPINSPDRWA